MGDKTFRGFQCLNKNCKNFLFIQTEVIDPDFNYECESCGFAHKAGETTPLYKYRLVDERDESVIEDGVFEILHDDYVAESGEFKYCVVCGALKPFEKFGVHNARRTGRQGECRVCKQVYNGIKNQSRLIEQHREASQKRRLYTHFEDAGKLDISAIYERFDNCCFKCGRDLSGDLDAGVEHKEGNLDHTLPVFYLWPLTTDNATLLCRLHNGQKAESWPGEFYSKSQLRQLSALTALEHRLLEGPPVFNPDAINKLKDANFIETIFEKFSRHPEELLRLRNRVLRSTGFDFLDVSSRISPDWRRQADALIVK